MKKTTNMRAGFTMIELIFVIVIIGVLAAIAMNKLSATRDDAKISQIIANSKTFMNDVKTYYTSQGYKKYEAATIGDVTDVPLYNSSCAPLPITTPAENNSTAAATSFHLCANGTPVVQIDTNRTHITIKAENNGTGVSTVADAVAGSSTFKAIAKSIRMGGTGVNFGN